MDAKIYLTMDEARALLGVSRRTMYKYKSEGWVEWYKPALILYFSRESLLLAAFGTSILNTIIHLPITRSNNSRLS